MFSSREISHSDGLVKDPAVGWVISDLATSPVSPELFVLPCLFRVTLIYRQGGDGAERSSHVRNTAQGGQRDRDC